MPPRATSARVVELVSIESPAASSNQCSTSRLRQPIARPRNRCAFGNRCRNASTASAHRGRRTRRATSCAPRISFHAGSGSFTHLYSETSLRQMVTGALVPDPHASVLIKRSCL